MGCASSAPLVEQGKNLVEGVKEAAGDTLEKGEKAIHDTTSTIKDGVSSGIDTVKETAHTAFNTVEESVGSVAHKIGETFNFTASKTQEDLTNGVREAADHISSTKDDMVATASETAAEAVSEAETVIVSETEHAREAFQSGVSPFFETVHSLDDDLEHTMKGLGTMEESMHQTVDDAIKSGTEVLEDLEDDTKNLLGETVAKVDKKVEELHEDLHKSVAEEGGHPPDKEEAPPTFWEAAADAILVKKAIKHMEPPQLLQERIFFTPQGKSDLDSVEKTSRENDIVVENTEN